MDLTKDLIKSGLLYAKDYISIFLDNNSFMLIKKRAIIKTRKTEMF